MSNEKLSNEAHKTPLNKPAVSGCFFLLTEIKPPKTDSYEVITNRGRVVECRYENFLGNDIWETKYENHNLNEKVVAWRFLKQPLTPCGLPFGGDKQHKSFTLIQKQMENTKQQQITKPPLTANRLL